MVEIPVQPPTETATPEAPSEVVASTEVTDAGPAPFELPIEWTATFGHTTPYADAMRLARATRANFDTVAKLWLEDAGAPSPKTFERMNALLDLGSRQLAAAYHAPDASTNDKIVALSSASDMILAWSRKLDALGLSHAPAKYRSDPSVALTFEDIATGPAKRWRAEGTALVQLCVELARVHRVESPAARDCASLRRTYAHAIQPKVETGCACDPGDPLCSATMNGWCRPK